MTLQNTIPCRVRLEKHMRNDDILKSIHDTNVAALPWQQASLRDIQRHLGISSLWDSLFLFQPLESTESRFEPLWEFEVSDEEEAQIQVSIHLN